MAKQKFEGRRKDILAFMLSRPQGTSVVELAKGINVSITSAERYITKLRTEGDIELCRAEPIRGVSKKPIKYYVVTTEAELDGVLKKSEPKDYL